MKKTFSQKQLAKLINYTPEHLSCIINGKYDAPYKKAKIIAKHTKTTPEIWADPDKAHERKIIIRGLK